MKRMGAKSVQGRAQAGTGGQRRYAGVNWRLALPVAINGLAVLAVVVGIKALITWMLTAGSPQ